MVLLQNYFNKRVPLFFYFLSHMYYYITLIDRERKTPSEANVKDLYP